MNSQEYRPSGFRLLPPVVKNILIINGLFYLATFLFGRSYHVDLTDILGLHYFNAEKFKFFQFITYMFMHDPSNFEHIFFNMFALWMFGNVLENYWGGERFLIYYLLCGIGAAITHYVIFYLEIKPVIEQLNDYIAHPNLSEFEKMFQPLLLKFHASPELQKLIEHYNSAPNFGNLSQKIQASIDLTNQFEVDFLNEPVVIGASGSVFGILLAFGMMFPNSVLYIYFAFPIKAKYFVIIYGLIELFSGVADFSGDNVAHFAHLGGMLFGFILIKIWQRSHNRF